MPEFTHDATLSQTLLATVKAQACIDRAIGVANTRSSLHVIAQRTQTPNLNALHPSQRRALRRLASEILSHPFRHHRHSHGCSCNSTKLLPIWPRSLEDLDVDEEATFDAATVNKWDLTMLKELRRVADVLSLKPIEEVAGIFHDLVWQAMRFRLQENENTLPWPITADVQACRIPVARRIGFSSFEAAEFATRIIRPTTYRPGSIFLSNSALKTAQLMYLGHEASIEQACAMLELWVGMEKAISQDPTTHTYDTVFGCSCLASVETKSTGDQKSGKGSPDTQDSHELDRDTIGEPDNNPHEPNTGWDSHQSSKTKHCFFTFDEGVRLFPRLLQQNRTALIPKLERLFHIAPYTEMLPFLHQTMQRAMTERLRRKNNPAKIGWYLLSPEDVDQCEREYMTVMGFNNYEQFADTMSLGKP